MELRDKLKVLADAAKYDASCASSGSKRRGSGGGWGGMGNSDGTGICHSYTPDGRCVSLLKILLTNHCLYDCQYCVNRISSDIPRGRFTPEEVVALTLNFYRRNYIEGLFLSSGIIQSVDYTMEQLNRVARTLRLTHGFNGYIHLKAIPGAHPALLEEAGRYADRLSGNIELPTRRDLTLLAPEKRLEVITGAMSEIKHHIDAARDARHLPAHVPLRNPEMTLPAAPPAPTGQTPVNRFAAGQSTQMIVGATPTPDREILHTAATLYQTFGLKRVYYSAFSPIPGGDPRLPVAMPVLVREHRLYQADWLMRHYGFNAAEIAETDNLPLDMDPKLAWALRHREFFPVDLNRAPRGRLLRVPGLGVRNVDRILSIRRHHAIRLQDLVRLKAAMTRIRPFIITADFHPNAQLLDHPRLAARVAPPKQLSLFDTLSPALTGEL
jgi:putative DNA modification/repair radical SAM protein